MKPVESPAGRETWRPRDLETLQQAIKTLQIAQRMLAGRIGDIGSAHIQLAIDLIEPLARRQATCVLRPINGGKADYRISDKPELIPEMAL